MTVVPLVLIFVSQFVAGIGVLLFFSLGGPYLDDNIKKTQSPMLFGKILRIRMLNFSKTRNKQAFKFLQTLDKGAHSIIMTSSSSLFLENGKEWKFFNFLLGQV
jgi:hypothetical protein